VNGNLLEDGVELLQFEALGGILFVLNRDIAAGTRLSTVFVLGAFHDHLYPVAFSFLCHDKELLLLCRYFVQLNGNAAGAQFFYYGVQATLVDGADGIGGKLQRNPFVFFGQEETLHLQVGIKPALGLDIRVAYMVAGHGLSTGYLTYACHNAYFFGTAKVR
jgi:hypothetical protein